MKYIDAEKLYKKVDELMAHYAKSEEDMDEEGYTDWATYYQCKRTTCSEVLNIITSLQQEQSEVDLKKEVKDYFMDSGYNLPYYECWTIARHFYEFGLKAREEESK